MKYFLDTNVIIDLMDNNPFVMDKLKKVWQEHEVFISDIAYYAILRGFKYKAAERKLKVFSDFCKHIPVVYQSYESIVITAENYALLKRSGILIEDDDILIGAVAIAHNGILATNNARHLSRIQGITLEVWQ